MIHIERFGILKRPFLCYKQFGESIIPFIPLFHVRPPTQSNQSTAPPLLNLVFTLSNIIKTMATFADESGMDVAEGNDTTMIPSFPAVSAVDAAVSFNITFP